MAQLAVVTGASSGIGRSYVEPLASQGMDLVLVAVPQMEPEQIVEASLSDLARGVVVSIAALSDESALTRFDQAASALLSVARCTELPPRYRAR